MRLRVADQRTAEQENIEPQNIEGWNRCALSFESIKLERILSFDIRYSIFTSIDHDFSVIRYSLFYPRTRCSKSEVSFWIKLAASAASGGAEPLYETPRGRTANRRTGEY